MDTLTHALSGALVARATAPRPGTPDAIPLSRRVGLGFVAAAFPDLDVATSWLWWPFGYLSCIGPSANGKPGMSRGNPVMVVAPVSASTETTEMLSNRLESLVVT